MKILLPTDFSDNAWSAAVYALNLFEDFNCTFYFLNAHRPQTPVAEYHIEKRVDVQKELSDLQHMARAGNANSKHNIQTIASQYGLVKAINTAVDRYGINFIVMGTKGATCAKEVFYGSNTVNVLKKVNTCPVLVVPDEFDYKIPEQIAFPTDFNRSYNDREIGHLKELALLHGSKYRVVHIATEKELDKNQKQNQEKLNGFLREFEPSFHWLPDYSSKANAITSFIEEMEINILAMINYRHGFLQRIIREPVIKKIGYGPIVPFFVIPE